MGPAGFVAVLCGWITTEVGRQPFTVYGLLTTAGDVAGLARALRWIHDHDEELPAMGRRGQALAGAFSAQAWATRWHQYFIETVEQLSYTRANR